MSILPKSITCETSTIHDGNMSFRGGSKHEVIENRRCFLQKFGIAYQEHIAMSCNHGDIITVVDNKHQGVGATEPADTLQSEVLVTQKKHLALFLLTADCMPVSFYDPVTQTIALAHISRATLVQKLVEKTVQFLQNTFSVLPQNLLVHIGPHIKKESYAFFLPLQETAPVLAPYTEINNNVAYIDLPTACVDQLCETGIQASNIEVSTVNTASSAEHYSYFMLKKNGLPDANRMATILMMR